MGPTCSAARRSSGAIGARAGNANLAPDQDGVIRRVPHSIQGLETFAVATAEAFGGDPVPNPTSTATPP